MNKQKAIKVLDSMKVKIDIPKAIKSQHQKNEAIDMAIEALTDVVNEDGTLTVHVSDGSKVSRVLVLGDNHYGGLYYADGDADMRGKENE